GRLMGALFVAQVCGSTGHSIGMAVGGIMAAEITGTNAWTGLPVALGALGTAQASWPLASLMARSGRRPGLVVGYGLAVVGAPLGLSPVGSAFLISLAGYGLASLVIEVLLRPDPLAIARQIHERVSMSAPARRARSLGAILRDPQVRIALGTLMTSQLVMI